MSKKNKIVKFSLFLVIIIAFGWYNDVLKARLGFGRSCVVFKKTIDERGNLINIKTHPGTTSSNEVSTIKVKDINIWNLIEENRGYYVGAYWIDGELPALTQIRIDDEFAKNLKELKDN